MPILQTMLFPLDPPTQILPSSDMGEGSPQWHWAASVKVPSPLVISKSFSGTALSRSGSWWRPGCKGLPCHSEALAMAVLPYRGKVHVGRFAYAASTIQSVGAGKVRDWGSARNHQPVEPMHTPWKCKSTVPQGSPSVINSLLPGPFKRFPRVLYKQFSPLALIVHVNPTPIIPLYWAWQSTSLAPPLPSSL